MAISILSRVFLAAAAFAAASGAATAGTIDVQVNQAKIIKLSKPADTIVIGNPLIADASVQDASTIVLTGKGFGETNLVVLADDGSPIIDEQISVSRNANSTVRIYRRANVQTLHCAPYCENPFKSPAESLPDSSTPAP